MLPHVPRMTVLAGQSVVVTAIALGAAIGVLVGLDAQSQVSRGLPFMWSMIGLTLCGVACLLVRKGADWFAHRDAIAVGMIIVACGMTGLNIGPLEPTDFAFLAILLFWMISTFVEHRPVVTPVPVLVLLAAIMMFGFTSIVNGLFMTILKQHTLISKIVLVFLLTNIVTTPALHRLGLRIVVVVAVASAIVAVGTELLYILTEVTLTFDDTRDYWLKDTPFGPLMRATSFTSTPQGLGHLLILGAALVLCMPLRYWTRMLLLSILAAGVACTLSSGAFLTLSVILVFSLFVINPHRSLLYGTCLVGAVLVAHAFGLIEWGYVHVFKPIGHASAMDRIEFIRLGLQAIERHPILGMGLSGTYRILPLPIHNVYMQAAAEIGAIGAVMVVAWLAYLLLSAWCLIKRAPDEHTKRWHKGMFLGLIGMVVHFTAEPFLTHVTSWLFMALAASAAVAYGRSTPDAPQSDAKH